LISTKCGRCSKEVYKAEEVIGAGLYWHQDCFKCATCKAALSSVNIRDKDKEIYCAPCYGKNFGPKGYGFGGGGGVGLRGSDTTEEGKDVGSQAIDADIKRKLALKYDSEKEQNCREWLQTILGETFPEATLQEALKSGVRLCLAANVVAPAIVKTINKQKFPAMQRENISAYLAACRYMAFNKASMFETSDLYDGNNMVLVIENIYELAKRGSRKGDIPAIKGSASKGGYDVSAVSDASSTPSAAPSYSAPTPSYSAPETTPAAAAAPAGDGATAFCPDCGAPRDGTSKFCADCGRQFDE